MTLNTNQTVSGQKTFSNIQTFTTSNGIPGGQAFNVTSFFQGYQTRLYSVNDTYSTDLYYPKFNGIDTLVSTESTATLQNKTLASTPFNGILDASAQNTVSLDVKMLELIKKHCLVYGNVPSNSFAGQSTDGAALVSFGGGVLGTSNGNWNLKWNNSSQLFTDTSNAGGTPWTVLLYIFNGYSDTGFYFSTNGSTYKTVGTAISGKYISYTCISPSNGAAYFNVSNADATYMGGFNATSGTGSGYFEVNGYVYVNSSLSQTYSYGFLASNGSTGTSSGTNPYSILATQRIKASEFNAVSSKKIKTVQSSLSDTNTMNEAINFLNRYHCVNMLTLMPYNMEGNV